MDQKGTLGCTRCTWLGGLLVVGMGFTLGYNMSSMSGSGLSSRVANIVNKLREQGHFSMSPPVFLPQGASTDALKSRVVSLEKQLLEHTAMMDRMAKLEQQVGSTSATEVWSGPIGKDIAGTGLSGAEVKSLAECQALCVVDEKCQALKFSATRSYAGNCFTFDNQDAQDGQFLSFELYYLTRPAQTSPLIAQQKDFNDQVDQKMKRFVSPERQPFHLMAQQLIEQTPSGGLVSMNRKLITVQLSIRAMVEGVPGDFVETGVFSGGTSILMAKILKTYAPTETKLWSADSFKGLPPDDDKVVAAGEEKQSGAFMGKRIGEATGSSGEYSSARSVFEENIRVHGLADANRINILEGFFIDTLPKAPIQKISFLRLDGDIYVSTKQPLDILYERLSDGGFIYIDDYGSYKGCRMAVDEYREAHGIWEPMIPVYENAEGQFEAVWWQKRPRPGR